MKQFYFFPSEVKYLKILFLIQLLNSLKLWKLFNPNLSGFQPHSKASFPLDDLAERRVSKIITVFFFYWKQFLVIRFSTECAVSIRCIPFSMHITMIFANFLYHG